MSDAVECRSRLPRFSQQVENGLRDGLHIGAQALITFQGQVVADAAWGLARPGVAMTTGTVNLWLSSTKPVVAVCLAQLWERGLLELDDPVAKHISEFAAGGKQAITIRHLLTHTAGIRPAAGNWSRETWDQTIARICAFPIELDWVPGQKAGYHLASSWFILGELIRRLDGRPLEQYVRQCLFEPLGMSDCWIGIPREAFDAYGSRIGLLMNTARAAAEPNTWDTPENRISCRPGANGQGPMQQLARFYQMLLNGGQLDGTRILLPQTVEALTARHRVGMFDHTFKHVMDWGLGLVVNNNQYGPDTIRYGYGPHASWRTFGHSGHQSSVALADPKHRIVAAIFFNGTPGEIRHDQRIRATLAALYQDLGCAINKTSAASLFCSG